MTRSFFGGRASATAIALVLTFFGTAALAAQGGGQGGGRGAGGPPQRDSSDRVNTQSILLIQPIEPVTPSAQVIIPIPPISQASVAEPLTVQTNLVQSAGESPVPPHPPMPSMADYRPWLDLPAATQSKEDLLALAALMVRPDEPKDGPDGEENPYLPAGYTYLGQFADHDLTFDPNSPLGKPAGAAAPRNLRTPRFDLDSVYGEGPDSQPYLYGMTAKGELDGTLIEGAVLANGTRDVARNAQGRALIGDPRNDENAILAQMHTVFIRLHNALARHGAQDSSGRKLAGRELLEWARAETTHTYQRILLSDFLPRIVDTEAPTVQPLFAALARDKRPEPRWYSTSGGAYIPREFAAAAYRFGHSMIRPGYRLSDRAPDLLLPIFGGGKDSLMGMRPLNPRFAIDWDLFFHDSLPAGMALDDAGRAANNAKNNGVRHGRVQFAYKTDTSIVDAIAALPPGTIAGKPTTALGPDIQRSLAVRNLIRGQSVGLPSGETLARAMGIEPLTADEITYRPDDANDKLRVRVADKLPGLAGNTPLWFYLLAEADLPVLRATREKPKVETEALGTRLGPIGGAIVAETFVGVMLLDPDSVLNQPTPWRSAVTGTSKVSMMDILRFIKPVS